ncbi:hypothetical protein RhiirA4_483796, partial [Rhizophagus irregularis]
GEYPRIAPFLLASGRKTTSELLEPYKDKVRRIHTDGFILEERPDKHVVLRDTQMQNTDGLGRQDHESFHTWAKRIQNTVQYYETCSRIRVHERPPYPRSRQDVYAYIAHIRRIVSRLPNRWYCIYCKSFND